MKNVRIYDEYFDNALGFYDKLLTRAYEQLKESGKVKSRAYVLIPDRSGFSRVRVTTIRGGKELERRLSDDKRTFDVYYVRNVKGFVCVEHKLFLAGKIEEWQLEFIKDKCSASVITKEGKVIVRDYPKGCFKKFLKAEKLSWSQLHA